MKKTWIKLKRGLLEKKHRDRLGIRIWLYLYIVDIADWDSGEVNMWKDANAAKDLEMPISTIRKQRKRLEDDGYITVQQSFQSLIITVNTWINPRNKGGKEHSFMVSKDGNHKVSNNGNHRKTECPKMDTHPITELDTPTLYPHINHIKDKEAPMPKRKKGKKRDPLLDHPAIIIYREKVRRHVQTTWRQRVVDAVGDQAEAWGELVDTWVGNGWNPQNIKGMLEAFKSGGIQPRYGGTNNNQSTREMLAEWEAEEE